MVILEADQSTLYGDSSTRWICFESLIPALVSDNHRQNQAKIPAQFKSSVESGKNTHVIMHILFTRLLASLYIRTDSGGKFSRNFFEKKNPRKVSAFRTTDQNSQHTIQQNDS